MGIKCSYSTLASVTMEGKHLCHHLTKTKPKGISLRLPTSTLRAGMRTKASQSLLEAVSSEAQGTFTFLSRTYLLLQYIHSTLLLGHSLTQQRQHPVACVRHQRTEWQMTRTREAGGPLRYVNKTACDGIACPLISSVR